MNSSLHNSWSERRIVTEKRQAERRRAEGEVVLTLTLGPMILEIRGQLKDISENGFCVAHGHFSLGSGENVRFRHRFGAGQARVVWNRVQDDVVESGFVILQSVSTVL